MYFRRFWWKVNITRSCTWQLGELPGDFRGISPWNDESCTNINQSLCHTLWPLVWEKKADPTPPPTLPRGPQALPPCGTVSHEEIFGAFLPLPKSLLSQVRLPQSSWLINNPNGSTLLCKKLSFNVSRYSLDVVKSLYQRWGSRIILTVSSALPSKPQVLA